MTPSHRGKRRAGAARWRSSTSGKWRERKIDSTHCIEATRLLTHRGHTARTQLGGEGGAGEAVEDTVFPKPTKGAEATVVAAEIRRDNPELKALDSYLSDAEQAGAKSGKEDV